MARGEQRAECLCLSDSARMRPRPMKIAILSVLMAVGCLVAQPTLAGESCPAPEATASSPDLSMAGIEDPKSLDAFLASLRRAVADHDEAALAAVIEYPLEIYDSGKVVATYPDEASVLKTFDRVFTPPVQAAIRCSDAADVFVNDQGAMLGDGEVWLDGWSEDAEPGGPIRIKAINP